MALDMYGATYEGLTSAILWSFGTEDTRKSAVIGGTLRDRGQDIAKIEVVVPTARLPKIRAAQRKIWVNAAI